MLLQQEDSTRSTSLPNRDVLLELLRRLNDELFTGIASEKPIIWASDADHCVATWRNVLVTIWRGQHTLQSLPQELAPVVETLIRKYRSNLVSLTIVEDQAAPPERRARREAVRLHRHYAAYVCAAAMVVEKPGMIGAMFRGIATAISRLSRDPHPTAFCATVTEATTWLAELLAERDFLLNYDRAAEMLRELRAPPP